MSERFFKFMHLIRAHIAALAAGTCVLALSGAGLAQTSTAAGYPNKPIRFVVPFSPLRASTQVPATSAAKCARIRCMNLKKRSLIPPPSCPATPPSVDIFPSATNLDSTSV